MSKIKFLIMLLSLAQELLIAEIKKPDATLETQVTETLKVLSSEEKEYLTSFFSELIFSSGGYVLLGNKPMCLLSYAEHRGYEPCDLFFPYEGLHRYNVRIKKGWQVWQKYASLFPMKNFLFCSETSFYSNNIQFITLINKKKFKNALYRYRRDIRKTLGRELTLEKIVKESTAGAPLLFDILEGNETVHGLLFGYGKTNAWLFQRLIDIDPWHRVKHRPFIHTRPKPKTEFYSLEEELQFTQDKLGSFVEASRLTDLNPLLLHLPGFRADLEDPETLQLLKEYSKCYHRILRYYKNKDFLHATLVLLMQ